MYAQASGAGQERAQAGSDAPQEEAQPGKDEDVVDADFEEVQDNK
jgi:hypothetical protein